MNKQDRKNLFKIDELKVAVMGLASITFLEGFAIFKGIDSIMFASAMGGLGVVVGWVFKSHTHKKK